MKKALSVFLVVLLIGLMVACVQDVTVDTDMYNEIELGTFVLNGKSYSTLQAAVDALNSKGESDDNVIHLTKNAKGAGAVLNGVEAVIDFGGHTFDFTNVSGLQGILGGDFGLSITEGSDVTLKGLEQISLYDTSTTDLTMVFIEGSDTVLKIEEAPKMVVEDNQYVFWAANGAKLIIGEKEATTSATVEGKVSATTNSTIILQGNSEVDTVVSSKSDVTMADTSKVTKGFEATDESVIFVADSSVISGDLTAKGSSEFVISTDDDTTQAIVKMDKDADSTITVASGTIDVKESTGESSQIETVGTGKISEDSDVTEKKDTVTVAMIGADKYESLEAAFNAADDNSRTVVTLVNPTSAGATVPATKNIALNLSKYTVAGNLSVTEGGYLELTGDTGEEPGLVTGTLTGTGLVVLSGAFTNDPGTHVAAYASVNGNNPYKASVNTDGVASIGTYYYASLSRAFGNGGYPFGVAEGETVKVLKDCSVSNDTNLSVSDVTLNLDRHIVTVEGSKTFTISGDNALVKDGCVVGSNYALYAESGKNIVLDNMILTGGLNATNGATVYVKDEGASVTGSAGNAAVRADGDGTVITLLNGSYSHTGNGTVFSEVNNGKIIVQGGIYTEDPSPYYTGKYAIKHEGDKWIIEDPAAPQTITEDTTKLETGYVYNVDSMKSLTLGSTLSVTGEGSVVINLKPGSVLNIPNGIELAENQTLVIRGFGTINSCIGGAGNIRIEGGTVNATGAAGVPGIQGNNVAIAGGTVNAAGGEGANAISGTLSSVPTLIVSSNNETWQNYKAAQDNRGRYMKNGVVVDSVSLDKSSMTIYGLGSTEKLVATVSAPTGADTTLLWESSNTNIATVDQNGVITAVAESPNAISVTAKTVDGSGLTATCSVTISAGIPLTANYLSTHNYTLATGVYLVNSNLTESNHRITVSGNVTLILGDGKTLWVTKGFYVAKNNSLTINGQTQGTGALKIVKTDNADESDVPDNCAAIGGNGVTYAEKGSVVGNITINGGKVTAIGGQYGAAIGGGFYETAGVQKITGGVVNLRGGQSAAGIGGGYDGDGGNVTISGGTVNTTGAGGAAGIGGGGYGGDGGNITITGGTVTARGGYVKSDIYPEGAYINGVGIGGGDSSGGTAGTIKITGGTVKAYGGENAAGIGTSYSGDGGTVTISSGNVTAEGGKFGPGIGFGYGGSDVTVTISGGTVVATGGKNGAGIGAGFLQSQTVEKGLVLNISGGTVEAYGGEGAAGIGSGYNHNSAIIPAGTVTITGGNVTATGGEREYDTYFGGAGIGHGFNNDLQYGAGINLTISGNNTVVNATGKDGAAGIGGSKSGNGGTVAINSGKVYAAGSDGAAGIGKGAYGTSQGTLTKGSGVSLQSSTDGSSWSDYTISDDRPRYIRSTP